MYVRIYGYVCIYMYMHVSMYICVHVCMYVRRYIFSHVCKYQWYDISVRKPTVFSSLLLYATESYVYGSP